MRTRDERSEVFSNLGLWIAVSIAFHSILLFVSPYTRPTRSFKIYPLANAGLIELGPSGGEVGGGPDNSSPGGIGGGGKAQFLNNLPDKEQVITRKVAPLPARAGRKQGQVASQAAAEEPRVKPTNAISTAGEPSTVKKPTIPKVNSGPVGKPTEPDIMTSTGGKDGAAATGTPNSGHISAPAADGRPDGSVSGSGTSNAQGALAGPGGSGTGVGGPGGEGDFPFAGSGDGSVLRGAPPVYPKYAESNNLEGIVRLRVVVDASGKPDPEVIKSSGEPVLDRACVRTIAAEWRFVPLGKPYEIILKVQFKTGVPVIPEVESAKPIN